MRRSTWLRWGVAVVALSMGAACETRNDVVIVDDDPRGPAAPRALEARYYDRAVYVTWELSAAWNGESFRVYGKRESDASFFLIADVTNCAGGFCSYTDTNVQAGRTYQYYVAAVDSRGRESATDYFVEVFVPEPIPPAVPGGMEVIALDGATYLRWDETARAASDFSHYRVYLAASDGTNYLLGETDSQGFLDELAENGLTYRYFVTALDTDGHESAGSGLAEATPRPDFRNEWVWDYFDVPELSGFRFRSDETVDPVVDGDSAQRHFRLETDADGWWLVPGPDAAVYPQAFETTALECGPGSDAGCVSLDTAPTSGYTTGDVGLAPQLSYVLRVRGDDGQDHYGELRITLLGFDQNGDGIMIFDWAYQLQAGNPELAPRRAPVR